MASELRRRGVPEWDAKGWMGHTSGGVTEVYAKYRPDYLGAATAVIEDYMSRVRVTCVLVLILLATQSSKKA